MLIASKTGIPAMTYATVPIRMIPVYRTSTMRADPAVLESKRSVCPSALYIFRPCESLTMQERTRIRPTPPM